MSNVEYRSRRRDATAVVGFVNFPIDRIESSGEGGCFVRLVVIDPRVQSAFEEKYMPCCGGDQNIFLDESFLGDDLFDNTYPSDDNDLSWKDRDRRYSEVEARYFPNLKNLDENTYRDAYRFVSIPFLCAMTIGATGWSSGEWVCTRNDLTPEGLALVDMLEKLYPNCEIRLLTFLDT